MERIILLGGIKGDTKVKLTAVTENSLLTKRDHTPYASTDTVFNGCSNESNFDIHELIQRMRRAVGSTCVVVGIVQDCYISQSDNMLKGIAAKPELVNKLERKYNVPVTTLEQIRTSGSVLAGQ